MWQVKSSYKIKTHLDAIDEVRRGSGFEEEREQSIRNRSAKGNEIVKGA